jgi:hypothetical protein
VVRSRIPKIVKTRPFVEGGFVYEGRGVLAARSGGMVGGVDYESVMVSIEMIFDC